MLINAPISLGELIDKITILEIKKERIKDEARLSNVNFELDQLNSILSQIKIDDQDILQSLRDDLKSTNTVLWNIEDELRAIEGDKRFLKRRKNERRLMKFNNVLLQRVATIDMRKATRSLFNIIHQPFKYPFIIYRFIMLARGVYYTNDERAKIKLRINILTGSKIVEVKSYKDY